MMTKQFQKELQKLAVKHGMDVTYECMYCARRCESLGHLHRGASHFITLTEIIPPARRGLNTFNHIRSGGYLSELKK